MNRKRARLKISAIRLFLLWTLGGSLISILFSEALELGKPAISDKIDIEGKLVKIDGVIFIPKGIWNPVMPEDKIDKVLKEVSEQGFNFILEKISPYLYPEFSLQILDTAYKYNLKVIFSLQRELYPEGDFKSKFYPKEDFSSNEDIRISQALEGVKKVKDHPAILGYFLGDEPDYESNHPGYTREAFAEFLEKVKKKIKQIDPNQITFLNLAKKENIGLFKNSADVIMHEYHCYTDSTNSEREQNEDYVECISEIYQEAKEISSYLEKPFWAVSFAYGNHYTSGLDSPRPPTPEEYESIFYQWLIGGVSGIIAYTYKLKEKDDLLWHLPDENIGSPLLWEKMKELNQRQEFLYPIVTQGAQAGLTLYPQGIPEDIKYLLRSYNGKFYLIAVNSRNKEYQNIKFAFNKKLESSITVLWEERRLGLNPDEDSFQDNFAPYQVHTYEFFLHEESEDNQPPVAKIQATPREGKTPLKVSFNSTGSYDPDGDPITYSWDFGDGSFTNLDEAFHTYTKAGNYIVTLTVSDGENEATDYVNIKVEGKKTAKPKAKIIKIAPNPAYENNPVLFVGGEGDIDKYNWRSSIDGFLSNKKIFVTDKLSAGIHRIYLKVKSKEGIWSDEVTRQLTIIEDRNKQWVNEAIIYGKVTDKKTGKPIPDAWVYAKLPIRNKSNKYLIQAVKVGYYDEEIWKILREGKNRIDFKLKPGWNISSFQSLAGDGDYYTIAEAKTDKKGRYELRVRLKSTNPPPSNNSPQAFIDSISPNPAEEGEVVNFVGHGEDADGSVVAYSWVSDVDGSLSNQASFNRNDLSKGTHTITFKVKDNDGAWSSAVTEELVIKPNAITQEEVEKFNKRINDRYKEPTKDSTIAVWTESWILLSFIEMYEATQDTFYLDKLVEHADSIFTYRDDARGIVDELRGKIMPGWGQRKYTNGVWTTHIVHTGIMTYPVALFSKIVEESASANIRANYLEKAQEYKQKIEESLDAYDDEWREEGDIGYYIYIHNDPDKNGSILPWNMMLALGRTFIIMSQITENPTKAQEYKRKVTLMAKFFRDYLNLQANGAYVWDYKIDGRIEDIGHGWIDIDFALLAYHNNIIFNEQDMERFTNTFVKNIYLGGGDVASHVDGRRTTDKKDKGAPRWIDLAQFDSQVYDICKELIVDYENRYYTQIGYAKYLKWKSKISNQLPMANISAEPTQGVVPLTVQFSSQGSSDPDGDPITYSWNFGDGGSSDLENPTHTYNNPGSYQVSLTVTDDKGASGSDSLTITVTQPINQPPVLAPIGDKQVNEGEVLTFTISATDPDGDSLTYSASNLPNGATFTNKTFSWRPNYNQQGSYQVHFEVSDGQLIDFEDITIIVNNINQPPTAFIDIISPNPAEEGETVNFVGHGEDTDGSVVAYSWVSDVDGNLSTEVSFNRDNLSQGTHTITFKVKDNDGAWSNPVTQGLVINPQGNQPPTAYIESITPNPAREGEEVNFVGRGEDEDGSIITYSWRSSIDGELSNQPSFSTDKLSVGNHIIYFKAKDNKGAWSDEVEKSLVIESELISETILKTWSVPLGNELKNKTDDELREIAKQHDFIMRGIRNEHVRNVLRQENPLIQLIGYVNAPSTIATGGIGFPNPIPDEWYLKDKNGSKIRFDIYSPPKYWLDIGNEEYREATANRIIYMIENWGANGVYIDDATGGIPRWKLNNPKDEHWPINPRTGSRYTDVEWHNDMKEFISVVRNKVKQVHPTALILFNELIVRLPNHDRIYNLDFLDVSDGALIEGWPPEAWNPENPMGETRWKRSIDNAIQAQSKPNIKFLGTISGYYKSVQREEDGHLFSLASYLLAKTTDHFYYIYRPFQPWLSFDWSSIHPLWKKVNLGQPVGNYFKAQNVYQRNFENGKVLVNPTTSTFTIQLDGEFYILQENGELSDNPVVEITLGSWRGAILIKNPEP